MADTSLPDMQLQAADSHVVVGPGELVATATLPRSLGRLWHYKVTAPVPARHIGLALGPWAPFVVPDMHAELRAAVAGVIESGEDAAAGGEAALLSEAAAAVTGFARPEAAKAGLLSSTMQAVRMVQCILEQWLGCPLPVPMLSMVFLPDSQWQVLQARLVDTAVASAMDLRSDAHAHSAAKC